MQTQEDFGEAAVLEKADLREAYLLGLQAVSDEKIIRTTAPRAPRAPRSSSPYTQKDVDDWATMSARCYETARAITNNFDRIQITPGYGLWTAGIGFQLGCELPGCHGHPWRVPANTENSCR